MRPPPACSSLVVRPDTATDEWSRVCDAPSDLPDGTYQDARTKENFVSVGSWRTVQILLATTRAHLHRPGWVHRRSMERPGDTRLETYAADNRVLVAVNAGAALLSAPDLSQTLGAGQAVHLVGTNPPAAFSVALPPPDDFDLWSRHPGRQATEVLFIPLAGLPARANRPTQLPRATPPVERVAPARRSGPPRHPLAAPIRRLMSPVNVSSALLRDAG
jgi:hypothetical protein